MERPILWVGVNHGPGGYSACPPPPTPPISRPLSPHSAATPFAVGCIRELVAARLGTDSSVAP
eukprot:1132309-Lingulodinium_polyedra.AAC.1